MFLYWTLVTLSCNFIHSIIVHNVGINIVIGKKKALSNHQTTVDGFDDPPQGYHIKPNV